MHASTKEDIVWDAFEIFFLHIIWLEAIISRDVINEWRFLKHYSFELCSRTLKRFLNVCVFSDKFRAQNFSVIQTNTKEKIIKFFADF